MKKVLLSLLLVCLVWIFSGCEEPIVVPEPKSSEKEISAFVFEGLLNPVIADIQGTAVTAVVPYGTDMTKLVVSYVTSGVMVSVNGVEQQSGITANDFTSTVVYTVQAEDETSQDYIVMIRQAESTSKSLTSFAFNELVNPVRAQISGQRITANIPYGVDVSRLHPSFQTTGQKVTVGPYTQFSGISEQDFTRPVTYTVHAADGSTTNYYVDVHVDYPKELTAFWFEIGGIEHPGVFDGANINVELPSGTDTTALTAFFTTSGNAVQIADAVQESGVTVNDFSATVTYRAIAQDNTFTDYTVSVHILPSDDRELLSFGFEGVDLTDSVYQMENDFIIVVPNTVDITSLTPEFTFTGNRLEINGVKVDSARTALDFADDVIIAVLAESGLAKRYVVRVLHENDIFITTWDLSGVDQTLAFPLAKNGTYSFFIDWGDGSPAEYVSSHILAHTFPSPALYTVKIIGTCNGFGSSYYSESGTMSDGNAEKLSSIDQWGNSTIHDNGSPFLGFNKLTSVNTVVDDLDISHLTNMSNFFAGFTTITDDITGWDMSNVTNISGLFKGLATFNQDISSWQTGNVKDMSEMFKDAAAFNQDISSWQTGNVIDMTSMFEGATAFNQDISSWQTGNVTNMAGMFFKAANFNQPIGGWNTGNVTNMKYMFSSAVAFDQPIGNWNLSNVLDISFMFDGAITFNQALNNWNVSKVITIQNLFKGAVLFNQPLANWNTSSVESTWSAFESAEAFNQPLNSWDVSLNEDFDSMFEGAVSFNQPLDQWNTESAKFMIEMFKNAASFEQDLSKWNVVNVVADSQWGPGNADFALGSAFEADTDLHPIWPFNGGM